MAYFISSRWDAIKRGHRHTQEMRRKCKCGGEKNPKHQICHACWCASPVTLRKRYDSEDLEVRHAATLALLEFAASRNPNSISNPAPQRAAIPSPMVSAASQNSTGREDTQRPARSALLLEMDQLLNNAANCFPETICLIRQAIAAQEKAEAGATEETP